MANSTDTPSCLERIPGSNKNSGSSPASGCGAFKPGECVAGLNSSSASTTTRCRQPGDAGSAEIGCDPCHTGNRECQRSIGAGGRLDGPPDHECVDRTT